MAYIEIPSFMVQSPELYPILQQLQWAINNLTTENFPQKIAARDILSTNSMPLDVLEWREWSFPLVLPGTPLNTTGTLNCGGYFNYIPENYPVGTGQWLFEATIQSTSGGRANAELISGGQIIAAVDSTSLSPITLRSAPINMPENQATFIVQLRNSSTMVNAALFAARLIYRV